MDEKKILIVTAAFYPQNNPRSFRATELAKELALQGHKVVVFVPFHGYDYRQYGKELNITFKDLGKLIFIRIPIKGNKIFRLMMRAITRLLLQLFEYPDIELMFKVRKALKMESNYDLLISIAVPHPIHWGVAWAITKKHRIAKTWVADCGDPFMGNKMDSFRKLFYFKYIEKWFCKKTDYIAVPAQEHIQYYYKEFWPKTKVIPQGFKFEDSKIFDGVLNNRIPTFAFAGRFLPKLRDPRPFLDYLCTLNVNFRFVVYTPNKEFLEPYKNKLVNKLIDGGFIPREKLLYGLSQMDFLVHIEFHSSVKSNSPSKFADYAIAKRPVIALNMENIDKQKFHAFLNKDYSQQMDLSGAEKFRIENVTNAFISLIADD